jgi:hypothetical protein
MPTIMAIISTAGVAGTAYLFARAGMKAERAVQHETRVNEEYENRYPTYLETAEITWHEYLIPASVGVATVVCIVSSNVLNLQNQATLMGAYALGERTWAKYRNKVAEMVGFDAEGLIRQETVRDVAQTTKVAKEVDPNGVIFMDVFSGQMFNSDEETIRKAMEHTNEKAEEDGFATLNYFYDRIGARTTQIGELMGWSDGLPLEIVLTPVTFEDGTEGFGLDYLRYPFMGYHEV